MSIRPISASSFREILKNPVHQQRLKVAAVALVTLAALGIVMAVSFKVSLLLMPLIIPVAVGGILIAKKLLNKPAENKAAVPVPSVKASRVKTETELFVEQKLKEQRETAVKAYQDCAKTFFTAGEALENAKSSHEKKMKAMFLDGAISSISNYIDLCGIMNNPLELGSMPEHQAVLKYLNTIEEIIKDEKDTPFRNLKMSIDQLKKK